MQHGAVYRESQLIIEQVMRTQNAWERMRGLLGRPALQSGQGMLIEPCNAIHMLGMRYPIDAVFVGKDGAILKLAANIRPLGVAAAWQARYVLELAKGEIDRLGLVPGDRLHWRIHE